MNEKERPTVQELSSLAAKGTVPEYPMTANEWLLWYELRDIYKDWRDKTAGEDVLKARKEKAVVRFDEMKRKETQHREDCFRIAKLYKNIEETATAYRKDRSLDNADRMMNVVYGLLGGE